MDLQRIKNLIKKNGDKFILVENDTPEIVMLSLSEYERLTSLNKPVLFPSSSPKVVSKTGSGMSGLDGGKMKETEFVVPLGPEVMSNPMRLEEVRLEDLPL